MVKTTVKAGICGFTTVIIAQSDDFAPLVRREEGQECRDNFFTHVMQKIDAIICRQIGQ